jgi:hypothetical protein
LAAFSASISWAPSLDGELEKGAQISYALSLNVQLSRFKPRKSLIVAGLYGAVHACMLI